MRVLGYLVLTWSLTGLGCSFSDQPAEVSGTVLIDGQPLEDGEIIFESEDRSKTPGAGPIKDGKYTILVLPGPKIVRIKASRTTTIPDPVMGSAAREARLGPEFNDQTTLKYDVQAGKQDGVNFEVKEMPRKK